MQVGIFGNHADPQVHTVTTALRALGADVVLVPDDALERGVPVSELDGRVQVQGVDLSALEGVYLRSVPMPSVPVLARDDTLLLYEDWFGRYMQSRERAAFYVAWLLMLQRRGARLINPPHAASVLQFKPFQLDALRACGAPVPRTLISNDPAAVRAFASSVPDVIFKPLLGGALTRRLADVPAADLEAVTQSPVIFQERILGDDVRVMLADDEVVSSVAIRTPAQHLDFRGDPAYAGGAATYEDVPLPDAVVTCARTVARACGLRFAGLDLKRTPDGRWVFLELNSSPTWLDVERKLGHPISRAVAELVVGRR